MMKSIKIVGYGSFYNIKDYHNDVIKKGAFLEDIIAFQHNKKKIRLLAHHNILNPIAKITKLEDRDNGLYIESVIEKNDNNVEIINDITNDLIGELSIGIIPLEYHYEKNLRIIKKAQLLEISVVTIGANPEAKILSVETIE